jgi:chromosome segregation ATPase
MTSRELPAALRAVFARIAELRAAIADRQRALSALESELAALRAEQERVRENLKVVPAGSSLQARYLKVLSEQEDRIAAVTGKLRGAREAVASAERALAEYVRGLSLSP